MITNRMGAAAVENENIEFGVGEHRQEVRVRVGDAVYCDPPGNFEHPVPLGQLSPPISLFQLLFYSLSLLVFL